MATTTASIRTSRENGIIVVDWSSSNDARAVQARFAACLADFDGVDVDPGLSKYRLYITVDKEKLESLSADDWEKTWVDLRERVGIIVEAVFGG